MAEGEGGGWWGGWLQQSFQAVKEKSAEALEFMKRDLTEFSQVVQHDTACTIAATANVVKEKLAVEGSSGTTEKMKKGLSNILGVITDTLAPPPDKTIDCDVITLVATPSGTTEVYDGLKARLYSLQADPATYCNEPDGPLEMFDVWLSEFNLEEKKGEISELLVNSPSVRALYTKMVPAAVSHSEFWQRYFYKLHQLEQEEARRVALKQRAEQTTHSEELGWEEEEDEFVGASSPSRLDFKPPEETSTLPLGIATPGMVTGVISATAGSECRMLTDIPDRLMDVTPSESSESVTITTQIENVSLLPSKVLLEVAPGGVTKKLLEASLEERDGTSESPKNKVDGCKLSDVERKAGEAVRALEHPSTTGPKEGMEAKAACKPEMVREDGPTDLRVFELNSDSGKSTPSNNGKKGSSTDISEDWEKEFDLDMTEEEVQLALSKVEGSGEVCTTLKTWDLLKVKI
nr:PREDICTED: BSD domain-containing protein 1 isoform X2 [Latimeria chalumnae]|eukprot:XP_014343676.1 PREDICTED: BSD domain-containing protein 1 isoform X2 [Latimeria chalumnae]